MFGNLGSANLSTANMLLESALVSSVGDLISKIVKGHYFVEFIQSKHT